LHDAFRARRAHGRRISEAFEKSDRGNQSERDKSPERLIAVAEGAHRARNSLMTQQLRQKQRADQERHRGYWSPFVNPRFRISNRRDAER